MRRMLIVVVIVAALLGACGGKKAPKTSPPPANSGLSGYDGAPPWPLAGSQVKRIQAAGVTPLTAEGSIVHYHVHLDVFYDGNAVTVPASVGIDFDAQRISPVHTHTDAGVIHIEANKDDTFTLGQFLQEWGVRVQGNCVADKCGDQAVAYVNGAPQDGSAASVVLKAGDEIALVLGTKPATIPSTYDCTKRPDDACPTPQ